MIKLMVGAIFDDNFLNGAENDFLDGLNDLNQKYQNVKVEEVYSSMRASHSGLPTARPDFRLADIGWDDLQRYIDKCHKYGIQYNYTMNASDVGDLEEFSKKYDLIVEGVKRLESMGIDRITISNPLLIDLVCKHTKIPIEASTIMNINSVQTPKVIKSLYPNIDKICMSLEKNRSIYFIQKMKKACEEVGITLEIMTNEFCMVDNAPCSNIHRNTCYILHSANMPQDVAQKGINSDGTEQPKGVAGYPWYVKTGCIFGRAFDKTAWLNSRTVWPNEFFEYSKLSTVDKFKVTCRTAPREFGLTLIERYMKGEYNGLLAGLWLQLQASTLSARKNFDKIQQNAANNVPYHTELLSKTHKMKMKLSNGKFVEGNFRFMDRYFLDPEFNPDDLVSVDKSDDELLPHEDNWVVKWAKISDINNYHDK